MSFSKWVLRMKWILGFLFVILLGALPTSNTRAASENACAIWICLPGGFPSGCGGAYGEFRHRIKKGRPPLPPLSSCTTGPNGERVDGRYQLGFERFEPCDDSYVLREGRINGVGSIVGMCYLEVCAPASNNIRKEECQHYDAVRREKPHYVKMWVDGDYLGQYFYQ